MPFSEHPAAPSPAAAFHRRRHHFALDPPASYPTLPFRDRQGAAGGPPPLKRRRSDAPVPAERAGDLPHWGGAGATGSLARQIGHPSQPPAEAEREVAAFVSRDEIERCSPSRKDGIDSVLEARLRYSYCSYLQNLGMRLELPQTTIATAVVLCHRFFFRRSHACHDRFLVATAALFLAAKSEETPCLLNTVLRASCEVSQNLELAFLPYMLHGDWFEQYRERVIETEQMMLTTLDFELDVKHPYTALTSVLNKLGLLRSALFSLAWNMISEGVFLRENNVLSCVIILSGGMIYHS